MWRTKRCAVRLNVGKGRKKVEVFINKKFSKFAIHSHMRRNKFHCNECELSGNPVYGVIS